ncbi:MAG: hypothetical protein HN731_14160 [Rhodospirillaceae bacterium]|jgi:hypothetical protein|nr:hypothetical protein [Rhodospirillaceae bacterium]
MKPDLKSIYKFKVLIAGAVFAVLFTVSQFVSSPSQAQANCGERKAIVNILGDRYAEKPVATGMTQGGGVVEVFAARDGSWTMIVTMPSGYACFMAAGEDWENLSVFAQGA